VMLLFVALLVTSKPQKYCIVGIIQYYCRSGYDDVEILTENR